MTQVPNASCVYVISSANGVCKIGYSSNPEARLAALQTSSAHPLKLEYTLIVDCDPREMEAEAHRLIARHRLSGEWFDVPPEIATEAVLAAARNFGIGVIQTDSERLMRGAVARPAESLWWFWIVLLITGVAFLTYFYHVIHANS